MLMSLDKLLADFFLSNLLMRSESDRNCPSDVFVVGNLDSKSSDFAGDNTSFICLQICYSKLRIKP